MKILVRLPNWLGDGVMATPFLQILQAHFQEINAEFILVGPPKICALFEHTPNCTLVVDNTKKAFWRALATYRLAKRIGPCDIAITLNNHFYAALLLYWTNTPKRVGYRRTGRTFLLTHPLEPINAHQVESYCHLLSPLVPKTPLPPLLIHANPLNLTGSKNIGVSPGAAFGSAKRWKPAYFRELIANLLERGYGVYVLGAKDDLAVVQEVLEPLEENSLLHNLCGKTSIPELIDTIAALDLFICNDSGPMHIAAALNIPIIALFGPTDPRETGPWQYKKATLLSKAMPCSPCKQRTCPLKHDNHACMTRLLPSSVLKAVDEVLA
ncbi:lipopolysaccharide heptosyltransferase II [Helicobacter sp. NHP22-001]|uniref:lipopolysaccharide heptosyltransferase II n=1 Tax=Helicobacter sp. NHP22-001 TaxID=3040202 RepID=UPI00244D8758|nr:lipopolysaccharide heptosyltransferase II [Helicobacter sp. NHP22-001]GMB95673.1 ADP-heptose-lps heptosyltransferase II [Helicobacter sp. NHP22-001]